MDGKPRLSAPATQGERIAWLESQALAYQHIIASLAAMLDRAGVVDANALAASLEAHADESAAARSGQVAARIVLRRQAKMIREQLAAPAGPRPFTVIPGGKDPNGAKQRS